jgi:hypothetical protein
MRVVLFACGAVFAAAAIVLVGSLLSGEMSPYLGVFRIRGVLRAVAYIGLPVAASLFFFRWASNMGRSNAGR